MTLAWIEQYEEWSNPPEERPGLFGRVETTFEGGVFGANVLDDAHGTGWSVDGSVPLAPGAVDLYLEVGADTRSRDLVTAGAYFPGLYESADIDLFIEFADREDYQSVLSAVAYWEADDGWTAIGGVRDPQGGDLEFMLGIAHRLGSLSH